MKLLKSIVTCVLAYLLIMSNANALIVDLGKTTGSPANRTAEFNRLLGQIELYNSVNDPDLPAPDDSLFLKTSTPSGPKSIDFDLTDLSGYLMFKWGNQDQFYYVENENIKTFTSTVLNRNGNSYLGLSHYSTWLTTDGDDDGDPIPVSESENMAIMLGIGSFMTIAYRLKTKMSV